MKKRRNFLEKIKKIYKIWKSNIFLKEQMLIYKQIKL